MLVSLTCKTPYTSNWVAVGNLPKACKYPKNLISTVKSRSSNHTNALFLQPLSTQIWVMGGDAGASYWVSIVFPV